jgi:hypothetical protein
MVTRAPMIVPARSATPEWMTDPSPIFTPS